MRGVHLYSYVLLVAAFGAALVRFTRNFREAEIQSIRLQEARVRHTQRLLGLVVLVGAAALTAFSLLHIGVQWLWMAALVAWLSGAQSLLVLVFGSPIQILWMERGFGVLFAGVAALIYLMFVR
jgi:phosphoglycerol transferase MdoB-like AlkP superfamily enzyme